MKATIRKATIHQKYNGARERIRQLEDQLEHGCARMQRLERQLEARDRFGEAFLQLVKVELER